jgi:hypothetical protein
MTNETTGFEGKALGINTPLNAQVNVIYLALLSLNSSVRAHQPQP